MIKKNQIMITALAIMIGVAGYLNFAGTKIGEEDFLSLKGGDEKLTYELSDISDEDMYAISLSENSDSDILSLDSDNTGYSEDYLTHDMEILGNEVNSLAANGVLVDDDALAVNSDGESDLSNNTDIETPGEAVFTSTTAIDSLAGAKLLKEQTRAKNKETLMEIINNDGLTENAKKDAINSMIVMTETAQKETEAEMLLEAKGYKESVVSISDGVADVMIGASTLSDKQTAQIMDIVQRKTDISPENIIITVSGTVSGTK